MYEFGFPQDQEMLEQHPASKTTEILMLLKHLWI